MLKKYYKNSVFFKTLLFSLIPILIVSVFVIILQVFHMRYIKERETIASEEMFESSVKRIEEDVEEIVNCFELLYSNNNIKQVMFMNNSNSNISIYKKFEIKRELTKVKNIYDFVANIAIVNQYYDFVIDANRECNLDVYFSSQRVYSGYDVQFWKDVQKKDAAYTFLAPVKAMSGGREEIVLPLIISRMNGINTTGYILVEIKCSYLYDVITQNRMQKNAEALTVIDNIIYEIESGNVIDNKKLLSKIDKHEIFKFRQGTKKYIGFQYTNKIGFFGSTNFVELIPQENIMQDVYANILIMICFIMIILIISIYLCYYFNKTLYKPIVSIEKVLEESNYKKEQFANEFELIENTFKKIATENLTLKNDAEKIISSTNEQYLIHYLSYSDLDSITKVKEIFNESKILFDKTCFLVAYLEVNYSKKFFEQFSSEQYMHICKGIYSIIHSEFNDNSKSIILAKSNEEFIIIFNLEEDEHSEVLDRISKLTEAFEFDAEMVKIFVGVGQIHKDFSGILQSYVEATKAYSILHTMPYKKILQYNISEENTVSFKYSFEQENKLINYIMGTNLSEVMHLVEEIALQNYEYGGEQAVKKVYNQIILTALRVASIKGIDYSKFAEVNDIKPEEAVYVLKPEQFIDYVNRLLQKVTVTNCSKERAVDIQNVVQYLNEHLSEDLFLDNVAEHFNTSPKNLSKLVKEQLGLGFTQYLSILRVEKAKKLLITTEYRISEIMTMTGFVSKTTFLRVFKKIEGVTPGEYRSLLKKFEKKDDIE